LRSIVEFIKFVMIKPFIFIYILSLTIAVLFLERYNPLTELLSGLVSVTNTDPAALLISVTQFLSDRTVVIQTMTIMVMAAVLASLAGAVMFSGFLGSFADGAKRCVEFPAAEKTGFLGGYKKFFPMLALFAASVLLFELLMIVWLISAVPLAIVSKAVEIGVLGWYVLPLAFAITVIVVYCGAVFLRVYSLSFIPAFYSSYDKPVRTGFRMAGKCFWRFLRIYFLVDFISLLLIVADYAAQNNIIVFYVRCASSAVIIVYTLFIAFHSFRGVDDVEGDENKGEVFEKSNYADDDDGGNDDDDGDDEEYDDDEYEDDNGDNNDNDDENDNYEYDDEYEDDYEYEDVE